MAIARASLDPARSAIVTANLLDPQWVQALPRRGFDAVLTATALHWIAPDRLTALYAEIGTVLRPGGVFINADRTCPTSRKLYDRKRTEGKRHTQAILALARRRVDVLWAMIRDGSVYKAK